MGDLRKEQLEYWNSRVGRRWVIHQESLDRFMQPIGNATIERAAVRSGERVIDVGCGCGGTTLELASKVGPSGSVLGVDISAPMLARARERAQGVGVANLDLVEADASTYAFAAGADLVFSRFGVMFFADPIAAFANLRRALRPGGRLVFVCFRDKDLNTWMSVPVAAAVSVVGLEPPTPPHAPGPFSLSDERRLRVVLDGAGFVAAACEPFDRDVLLGADLELATDFSVEAGPAARVIADATDDVRVRVRAAVRQALVPHAQPGGVSLRAATWIVQATNPAETS